jgi:hypothetical protein
MTAARSPLQRLKLGQDVRCTDGPAGELSDVVIDPHLRRVTHLVVQPHSQPARAHLVPFELAGGDEGDAVLSLHCTTQQLRAAPRVREIGSPEADRGSPEGGEAWDVGIREAVVMPRLDAGVFVEYAPDRGPDIMTSYDRVPKGGVEIRRTSSVTTPASSTGFCCPPAGSPTSSSSAATSGTGARSPSRSTRSGA